MRHRVASKQLQRDTKHRESLIKNLARAVFEHGAITTTRTKAKVVQPVVEHLITTALPGDVAARRLLHEYFGKRDVVNTLVDRIVPAIGERRSGFTRITDASTRSGDNATLVELSLVDMPERIGNFDGVHTRKEAVKKPAPKVGKKK